MNKCEGCKKLKYLIVEGVYYCEYYKAILQCLSGCKKYERKGKK